MNIYGSLLSVFFSGNFLGNELETIMLSIYGQKKNILNMEKVFFLLWKNFFHFAVKLCLDIPQSYMSHV